MAEVRCSSLGHACRRLPSPAGHGKPAREWVFICWGSASRLRSWQSTGSSPDAILGGTAVSSPRPCDAPGPEPGTAHRDQQRPNPPCSARPRSRGPGPARDQALPGSAAEAAPLLGKGHGRGPSAAHPRSPRQQRTGPGPRGPLSAPRGKDAAEGKRKRGKRSVPEAQGAGWPRMAGPGLTGADGASTAGRGKRGRGLARKR